MQQPNTTQNTQLPSQTLFSSPSQTHNQETSEYPKVVYSMPFNPSVENPQSAPEALSFGQVQYDEEERVFLQNALDEKLGQNYVTSRPGPGGKPVHYISTATAITLANQTFGFNGWSSAITEMQIDFVDQAQNGRYSIGVSATVRVTLKDGAYHEDAGYGSVENLKDKGQAIENAKKKAVSDALKRALRSFGNAMGLSVYDRDHLTALTRSKSLSKYSSGPVKEVGHNTRPQNPHFAASQNISSSPTQNDTSSNGNPHSTPSSNGYTGGPSRTMNGPPKQAPNRTTFNRSPTPTGGARSFQNQGAPPPPQQHNGSIPNNGPPPQQQHNSSMPKNGPPPQKQNPSKLPPQQQRSTPPGTGLPPQQRTTPPQGTSLPPQQQRSAPGNLPPQQRHTNFPPPQQSGNKRPNEYSNQGFQPNKKMRR